MARCPAIHHVEYSHVQKDLRGESALCARAAPLFPPIRFKLRMSLGVGWEHGHRVLLSPQGGDG